MKLVENEPRYYEFIRRLRDDKEVKKGFIQQEDITEKQHQKFMMKYASHYYICIENNIPIGFVGVIDDDIRVATHPDHQAQGVGTFMISELIKRFPMATAKVKIENEASLRIFEKCGFKKKYYILEKE